MRVPVNRPLLSKGDKENVAQILELGMLSGNSDIIHQLESELSKKLSNKAVILLSSGTVACDLATTLANVGRGDVVVAPAATIISTISEAARRGAKIKLVDHDPNTWCPDYSAIGNSNLTNVKAVYISHLYGMTATLGNLQSTCKDLGISVIEDAAEVFGQTFHGQPCGTLGDFGIFSFYSNKVVTSGEGGALVVSDEQAAKKARSLKNLCFGENERLLHDDLGWNYRMGSLQAALLFSQVNRLDAIIRRKIQLATLYSQVFAQEPSIQIPLQNHENSENHYWTYGIVLRDLSLRGIETMRSRLNELGIETRRFFPPLYLQPALVERDLVSREEMPVAELLWDRGIILPFGSGITEQEIQYVAESVISLHSSIRS